MEDANMRSQLSTLLIGMFMVVVIIGVIYNAMNIVNTTLDDSYLQKSRYDSAVKANAALQSKMDSAIVALTDSINTLNYIIDTKTAQIQTLRVTRNEGTTAITKFSTSRLTKFLTEELYRDSIR